MDEKSVLPLPLRLPLIRLPFPPFFSPSSSLIHSPDPITTIPNPFHHLRRHRQPRLHTSLSQSGSRRDAAQPAPIRMPPDDRSPNRHLRPVEASAGPQWRGSRSRGPAVVLASAMQTTGDTAAQVPAVLDVRLRQILLPRLSGAPLEARAPHSVRHRTSASSPPPPFARRRTHCSAATAGRLAAACAAVGYIETTIQNVCSPRFPEYRFRRCICSTP